MILVLSMYYSIIVCYVYKKFVHENYEIWLIHDEYLNILSMALKIIFFNILF